ncbi:CPBP family intramembrane glutamic endopeptidase [Mucilaginibacter paludis]|uniref:Abortive infection protein n=1 Tax=Mucilaginibacter paludis DSM 18603 TaxID=714943 RepID=H1YIS6_9SPHI|nr:CPBP family intramembrane glutamic endopeptidase [Mucilaginibacter paludis]EHQ27621.1 Abortive infection protein [Mucilaginibacter paludis DSM 18603]
MTEEAQSSMHPSLQFLLLIVTLIVLIFMGVAIGGGVVTVLYGFDTITQVMAFNTSAPNVITSIWILQILSTTIPLFLTAVVFARFMVKQPQTYLKPRINVPVALFLLVLVIMFFSSPAMDYLININQKMTFPGFLKSVEQWMRQKEDAALKETQVLLQMKTVGSMLFDLLVIGLLTAIAEEFLFRGCVQAIFTRWTNNPHGGIWIAAILFSAFHMQFFGFLPRMFLGVFFGYFVLYSNSIWTSVWAHFINNGTAVVVTYLYQQKKIAINPDDQHVFNYSAYAFSLIITVLLFLVYKNTALSKKQLPEL